LSQLVNNSSKFQKSKNSLHPSKVTVRVYVENTPDSSFWQSIFEPYETQIQVTFKFSPYSGKDATTGKRKLESLISQANSVFLICLDSDYDYLLQSKLAQIIQDNPFVFQTYAYAMENLKCYPNGLNILCRRATHNYEDDTIDISLVLAEYSRIIYPLLISNLYFYYSKQESRFPVKSFRSIVTIGNLNPDNYQDLLNTLESSIIEKQKELAIDVNISDFSKQFSEITTENAYLFMNCHALYATVLNLLKGVCKSLKNQHKERIDQLAEKQKKSDDEKNYNHETGDIKTLLDNNDKFTDCFLFQKITADIENYLNLFKQPIQEITG